MFKISKFLLLTAVIILTVIFNNSCSKDSDVLATYKGGKVTRGEFYKWFMDRSPRANKDRLFRSNREMENRLKGMIFQRILVSEAKESGFMDSARMKTFIKLISDHILAGEYIKKEVIEKNEQEFEIAKAKHIFLRIIKFKTKDRKRVSLSPEELEKSKKEKLRIAENLIKEINNGTKFEDLAEKYSEDGTRNKKGAAGFVVKGLMPDNYVNTLFSLEEGKLAQKPVETDRGIYILQLEEKINVPVSEIANEVKDKNQVNRIEHIFKSKIALDFINSLKKASDVKYNEKNIEKNEGKDLVFQVGKEKYSVDDINEVIKIILGNQDKKQRAIPLPKKKQLVNKIFENFLIKRKALADGFDSNEEYINKKDSISEMIIAREFRRMRANDKIEIDEKMIRDEYNKNKKRYYKTVKENKKTIKKPLSYKDAKKRIENTLISRERSKRIRKWRLDLETKYQIKIDKSKLDVKEKEDKEGNKNKIKRKRRIK